MCRTASYDYSVNGTYTGGHLMMEYEKYDAWHMLFKNVWIRIKCVCGPSVPIVKYRCTPYILYTVKNIPFEFHLLSMPFFLLLSTSIYTNVLYSMDFWNLVEWVPATTDSKYFLVAWSGEHREPMKIMQKLAAYWKLTDWLSDEVLHLQVWFTFPSMSYNLAVASNWQVELHISI